MENVSKRNGMSATKAVRTSGKQAAGTKPELVTYSFNLDDIRDIRISVTARGVVVTPPRPRPFTVEVTVEQTGH